MSLKKNGGRKIKERILRVDRRMLRVCKNEQQMTKVLTKKRVININKI